MSENTATVIALEEKAKRGRKAGSTLIPNSVVRAFLIRTNEAIATMAGMGMSIDEIVIGMAPTVKATEEFKNSEEFKMARAFKIAESMSGWDALMREDYILAILATATPDEIKLIKENPKMA